MPKNVDYEWLLSICGDQSSREWIRRIKDWRVETLGKNRFIDDGDGFVVSLGGQKFKFYPESAFSAIEVYEEIFKYNNHFLAEGFSGRECHTVIDVGANVGFYSLRLKQSSPHCRIVAVEPNPHEIGILADNIKLNGFGDVILEEVALAGCDGEMQMDTIPQMGAIGGALLRIPQRPWIKDEFVKVITVKTTTLDKLMVKHGLARVDILKMDVEGAEVATLEASHLLERVARIVVEYHSDELRRDLIDLLASRGFMVVCEDRSTTNSYSGDLYFSRGS